MKTCARTGCDRTFLPRDAGHRFCSPQCRNAAMNPARNRARHGTESAKRILAAMREAWIEQGRWRRQTAIVGQFGSLTAREIALFNLGHRQGYVRGYARARYLGRTRGVA